MEDGYLSSRWRCYFCNPRIGDTGAEVVPDQESLEEMLQSIEVKYKTPKNPIEKPVYDLPSDIESPGDSWTCNCQTIYDDRDKMQSITVKVYLDKETYHQELLNPPDENFNLEEIDSDMSDVSQLNESVENEVIEVFLNTEDPIFRPEEVSKKDNKANQKSDYDKMVDEWESYYERTMSSLGCSSRATSIRSDLSERTTTEELDSILSNEDSDLSMGSLDDTNSIEQIIERVDRLNTPVASVPPSSPATPRPVECVFLSSDSDESIKKPIIKRKRIHREKDISIIDLEAIGLNCSNNFIKLGEVKKVKSSFGANPAEDTGNREFFELRKFREFYRNELKIRVENHLIEEDTETEEENNMELLGRIVKMTEEISIKRARKETLETINRGNATLPMEKSLLTFAHPSKIHGIPRYTSEGGVTPYKMKIKKEEINFPSEWSDDLPFKGSYSATNLNITGYIPHFLNQICEPGEIAPKYDTNDVIKLINIEKENILLEKGQVGNAPKIVAPIVETQPDQTMIETAKVLKEASDLFYDL